MAITKVAQFVTPPVDVDDYDAQNAHIAGFTRQLAGPSMALTEWENTTTIPKLALGTYLSHGGYLYRVDTEDYVINGSSDGAWYIRLEASGDTLIATWTLNTQIVNYAWNAVQNGLYYGTAQLLPYQAIRAGEVWTKRKIMNLWQGSGFQTVDYLGAVSVAGALGVTGAISGASVDTGDGARTFDQGVETTDSPTFATVNTGQGANELYPMNQDVKSTASPTFATINTGYGANEVFKQSYEAYTISSDTTMNSMIVGETRWTTVYESDESYLKLPSGGTYLIIGTDRRDANGITNIGSWIEPDLMSGGERISSYQDGYNFYSMFIIRRIS